jgi:hypothetical protein
MTTTRLLKIISTNWTHLVGFYLTTYLSFILFKIIGLGDDYEWDTLWFGFISAGLLFIVYGLDILGYFVLTILTMDIISFSWTNKWIKETLIIQWIIISTPFIYWAFEYQYWLWITLSISLLITQMIRRKKIEIINKKTGTVTLDIKRTTDNVS